MLEEQREHPMVQLARKTVNDYIKKGIIIEPPEDLPEEMQRPAGVFVTLQKDGVLRGCIGTVEPTRATIAEEIIANAISAATRDSRFSPVTRGEVADLQVSVDVLGDPEQTYSLRDLNPKIYGVIVEAGRRRGLLLPDLQGVNTPWQQIDIALRKGGIQPSENYKIYRFKVIRYGAH
jgi:MEMO1 family protein